MKQIPYGRHSIDQDDIREVVRVLRSDWITQGPKVKEFEENLARYCGARYALAVSSGTAALHLAALVLGLRPSDEVITTAVTFSATANAVLYAGAHPVFTDIDAFTRNISPAKIEGKISSKTKALIPVHFAGLPCDMGAIYELARKNNLTVIEDACHALGAQYRVNGRWQKIGSCSHSDMTIFSFHPLKSITTGEGGAITTNDKKLFERLLLLRNHGISRDEGKFLKPYEDLCAAGPWYYKMQELGFNFRISDIQCALGISQLKKIPRFLKRREEIARCYSSGFSGITEIGLPVSGNEVKSAWHLFSIAVKEEGMKRRVPAGAARNNLYLFLHKKGIRAQVHYIPVYLHPFYRHLGYKPGLCPEAERFYRQALSLPLYPALSDSQVRFVIRAVKDYYCKERI